MSFQDYNDMALQLKQFTDIYGNPYSQDNTKFALEQRTDQYSSQILHPLPSLSRQSSGHSDDSNNRPLLDQQHSATSAAVYSQPYTPHPVHDSPQGWTPYDQQDFSPNHMSLSYDSFPTPAPFPAPRLSPAPVPYVPAMQSVNARMSLAGSLDPKTGIFYRTPEHPRLRTAQACEKCRTRKAKCSGEHPSCKRCISRGLICEYAKEGRVRGPNKPKLLKTGNSAASTDSSPHTTSRGRTSSATSSAGSQEHRDIPQQVIKALREQSLQAKAQRMSLPTETSSRRHSIGEQRSNLHLDVSSSHYRMDGPRSGGPEPRGRQFHAMVQRPPLQHQRTVEILRPSLTRAPQNSVMGNITPYQPSPHLSGTSHIVGMPGPEGMHYGDMVRTPGVATSQSAYMHQQRCREVGLILDDGFDHENEFRHGSKSFPSPQSVASMGSPMIQNHLPHYSRNCEQLENHGGSMSLDSSWVDLRPSFNGNHAENTYAIGHGQRTGASNGLYSAEKEKQIMGSGDPHSATMHYPMDLQIC